MFDSSLKTQLRFHVWGILLSIIVSLIVGLPAVIFHFSSDYHGVDMIKTNAENFYVTQIQEVYDGHPGLGNPTVADLKNNPYLFPPFSPNLVATIGKIVGLTSAVDTVLITRFLFAALLTFFIYLFAWQVTKRRAISLISAVFVTLGYNLIDPANVKSFLFHFYQDNPKVGFLSTGRPINPSVSSLIFFAYLNCFWQYLYGQGKKKWGLLSTLLLGLSFYSYLFTWLFAFSFNGFLAIALWRQKDWTRAKKIIGVSFGALLLGIPYVWHTFQVINHPFYTDSAPRFGFLSVRDLNISRTILVAFGLFLLTRSWFKEKTERTFWFVFFLTAVFVVNEQFITGKFVFNHHFHWYYNIPLVIIFLSSWLIYCVEKYIKLIAKRIGVFAVFVVMVLLISGIAMEHRAYEIALPSTIEEQRYTPLFSWLNKNTEADSTVVASLPLSGIITAFTHNNVYASGNTLYTLIPNDRLMWNLVVLEYLENTSSTDIRGSFEENRSQISNAVFGNQYHLTPGLCSTCFPDSVIDSMVLMYNSLSDKNFISSVQKYPAQYIVWDKKNDPDWSIDRFGLPVVANFNDVVVYILPKP